MQLNFFVRADTAEMRTIPLVLTILGIALTGCSNLHSDLRPKVTSVHPEATAAVTWAGLSNVVEAAVGALKPPPVRVLRAQLIAWSARLDHLGVPPRLSEDAVVLLETAHERGSRSWALAYLWRAPGGGRAVVDWQVPSFPPPFATITRFSSEPSEAEIAQFISASDFAYHACHVDQVVIDVVVYRDSAAVLRAASERLSEAEKSQRYDRYVGSIPY